MRFEKYTKTTRAGIQNLRVSSLPGNVFDLSVRLQFLAYTMSEKFLANKQKGYNRLKISFYVDSNILKKIQRLQAFINWCITWTVIT